MDSGDGGGGVSTHLLQVDMPRTKKRTCPPGANVLTWAMSSGDVSGGVGISRQGEVSRAKRVET